MYNSSTSQNDFVSQGKALALAIKGLMALDEAGDDYGAIEAKLRPQLIRLYSRELKRILIKVSKEEANEILAIIGPREGTITSDPSLN